MIILPPPKSPHVDTSLVPSTAIVNGTLIFSRLSDQYNVGFAKKWGLSLRILLRVTFQSELAVSKHFRFVSSSSQATA